MQRRRRGGGDGGARTMAGKAFAIMCQSTRFERDGGQGNSVGRARGGEPGRGTESKEFRGEEGAAVAAAAEQ